MEPHAYEFSAKDQALIRAGKFELINVRPLRARIAAVLYEVGATIWEILTIPARLLK